LRTGERDEEERGARSEEESSPLRPVTLTVTVTLTLTLTLTRSPLPTPPHPTPPHPSILSRQNGLEDFLRSVSLGFYLSLHLPSTSPPLKIKLWSEDGGDTFRYAPVREEASASANASASARGGEFERGVKSQGQLFNRPTGEGAKEWERSSSASLNSSSWNNDRNNDRNSIATGAEKPPTVTANVKHALKKMLYSGVVKVSGHAETKNEKNNNNNNKNEKKRGKRKTKREC